MKTSQVEVGTQRSFVAQAVRYGIPFGLGMALIWWAIGLFRNDSQDFLSIILFGLLAAVIAGVLIAAYESWHWKKVEDTALPDFSADGELLLATPALHDSIPGWLAANAREILFRVKSTNATDRHYPLHIIHSLKFWKPTGSSGEGIELVLATGETEHFEVENLLPWKNLIATHHELQVKFQAGESAATA